MWTHQWSFPWEWKLMYESYYISWLRVHWLYPAHFFFYPVLHQSVIFQTTVLKVFHSFQVPFSSFLPVSPSPASSSLPVGGDFPVPLTPSASLSFLFGSQCFVSDFISLPTLSLSFPILFYPLSSPQEPLISSRAVLFFLTCIFYLPVSASLLADALYLKGYSKLTYSSFFPRIPSF